ncbi:MAG: DUF1330 domain-containing protein [Albidovulum sp.]|nr:DUF1330 domain-containing protein [Albidovulum sp.]MDE0305292.1 DUF1330 domain-containing protein [Albidovulum sp.]MDE0531005.1 DUF1330 domain-containing protein [Albidovulum sp.]
MSALWIALVDVKDADTYGKYAELATKAITEHGGSFLARGGRCRQLEGKERLRNVVIRFPSFDAALECYNSDTYRKALEFSSVSSERDMVIVEEL